STKTSTILDTIAARVAADLPGQKQRVSIGSLERRIRELPPAVPFAAALRGDGTTTQVIAEIKRASPSKGVIAENVDPAAIARDYRQAGAAAISVLTNEPFFRGSLDDLEAVAGIVHPAIPVLRKDFLIDPYQVAEARAAGADAVLLIVALLPGTRLSEMLAAVGDCGLEALVEIHDEQEAAAAIGAGANVIGINNRDLRTFQVDLATTEWLAPMIPKDRVLVAESGIHSRGDVARLSAAGARAVLVGESLMLAADRRQALRELLG
ncbi:MAG TPA: indole-3-glycerol phosphate synthase TrpC, partial [Thermomicrobiaceae bacterium]|nr:indole-3-glycerol phosphate synthase TrpC [Thermomicrobiaceae bacterium]